MGGKGAVVTLPVNLGLPQETQREKKRGVKIPKSPPPQSEIPKLTQPPPRLPSFLSHFLSIHPRQPKITQLGAGEKDREWQPGNTPKD